VKFVLAATAVATLVACGGGGDDGPVTSSINLSPLVGVDSSVYGAFSNSCTGTGTDVASWAATATGDVLTVTVMDKYSAEALIFTLKYFSGDNSTGYNFSGSVKDVATGEVSAVNTTSLKNNSTSGGYNLVGSINATSRGCSVAIELM